MEESINNPLVFISYSWDSEEHKDWVLNFANNLVKNGVDVHLDQYELSAGKEMTYFMEKAMASDKVLVILTPNYKLKADKRQGGVGYEYSMLSKEFYDKEPDKHRIIPILRKGESITSCPIFIQTTIFHDMRDDVSFDAKFFELIKIILNKPLVKKPQLGKLPTFEDDSIPDIEKSIIDYRSKEELYSKKKQLLESVQGRELFFKEINQIIEQISAAIENYKTNFGFQFLVNKKLNKSITFSTIRFSFYFGIKDVYFNSAKDAKIDMNFFQGIVGMDEFYLPQEEPKLIYRSEYLFDVDEKLNPIFVKKGSPNVILTSHDIATVGLREVITNEIKYREKNMR